MRFCKSKLRKISVIFNIQLLRRFSDVMGFNLWEWINVFNYSFFNLIGRFVSLCVSFQFARNLDLNVPEHTGHLVTVSVVWKTFGHTWTQPSFILFRWYKVVCFLRDLSFVVFWLSTSDKQFKTRKKNSNCSCHPLLVNQWQAVQKPK